MRTAKYVVLPLLMVSGALNGSYRPAHAPPESRAESRPAASSGSRSTSRPLATTGTLAEAESAARAGNQFGLDLFAQLRNQSRNLFFSPICVELALALTHEGARGATEKQMRDVLHLSDASERGFLALIDGLNAPSPARELDVASALWGDLGVHFSQEFIHRAKTRFGGGLERLDFGDPIRASAAINRWVEEKTHERITNLVSPEALASNPGLVITNAVYFKGRWQAPFAEKLTRDDDFAPAAGGRIRVPFLLRTGHYRYFEDGRVQVLQLPYAGGDVEMVVILPRRAKELTMIERSLSHQALSAWIGHLNDREVEVQVPRFKLTTDYQLNRALAGMGMTEAFDPRLADFSAMDGTRDLFVGAVLHKAFVEVNEQGTEAAAATGVVMARGMGPSPPSTPIVFRADHPFLFLIRDPRTQAILFLGRLADPRG